MQQHKRIPAQPKQFFNGDITSRIWVMDAECAKPEYDPEIWFPETRRGDPLTLENQEKRAIAICNQCPVLDQCFKYACRYRLSHERIYGVWAGRPAAWYDDRQNVARTLKVLETGHL